MWKSNWAPHNAPAQAPKHAVMPFAIAKGMTACFGRSEADCYAFLHSYFVFISLTEDLIIFLNIFSSISANLLR
jgi:hypothetical protein